MNAGTQANATPASFFTGSASQPVFMDVDAPRDRGERGDARDREGRAHDRVRADGANARDREGLAQERDRASAPQQQTFEHVEWEGNILGDEELFGSELLGFRTDPSLAENTMNDDSVDEGHAGVKNCAARALHFFHSQSGLRKQYTAKLEEAEPVSERSQEKCLEKAAKVVDVGRTFGHCCGCGERVVPTDKKERRSFRRMAGFSAGTKENLSLQEHLVLKGQQLEAYCALGAGPGGGRGAWHVVRTDVHGRALADAGDKDENCKFFAVAPKLVEGSPLQGYFCFGCSSEGADLVRRKKHSRFLDFDFGITLPLAEGTQELSRLNAMAMSRNLPFKVVTKLSNLRGRWESNALTSHCICFPHSGSQLLPLEQRLWYNEMTAGNFQIVFVGKGHLRDLARRSGFGGACRIDAERTRAWLLWLKAAGHPDYAHVEIPEVQSIQGKLDDLVTKVESALVDDDSGTLSMVEKALPKNEDGASVMLDLGYEAEDDVQAVRAVKKLVSEIERRGPKENNATTEIPVSGEAVNEFEDGESIFGGGMPLLFPLGVKKEVVEHGACDACDACVVFMCMH